MRIYIKRFHKLGSLSLLVALFTICSISKAHNGQDKINFWTVTQKGANIFNQSVTLDDIKAAREYGIKFIRLAPDKFISTHRDFLVGNADDYHGLVQEDLARLKQILDMCLQE
jgi:hypothetical protein